MRRLPALAAIALALTACTQSALTWRAEQRFEPLPPGTPVQLYVRASAPQEIREALLDRGAEEVAAFPDGERVAEIVSRDELWLSWDALLDDVRERARELGADGAMATGGLRALTTEGVVYFQLVRTNAHGAR